MNHPLCFLLQFFTVVNKHNVVWVRITCGLEQGLVLNSSFGRMIFHLTFYRNTISFSINPKFSSSYSVLSDTPGGNV